MGQQLKVMDALIASIREQTVLPEEIIICGNLENVALRERVDQWKILYPAIADRIVLLFSGVRGVNAARNAGLRQGHSDIFLLLDDDCILDDQNFIFRHRDLHHQHPDVTALGGPYRLTPQAGILENAYHWNAHYWLGKVNQAGLSSRELLGGNLSLKRLLLGSDLFSETIRFGGAETELLYRLQAKGHRLLWDESLSLLHANEVGWGSFFRKAFLQGYGLGRRLKLQWQSGDSGDPHHLREIFAQLRLQETPLFRALRIVAMIYIFESVFQLGIEYAYSEDRHNPAPPTLRAYLIKKFRTFTGWEAFRRGVRLLQASTTALALIKDSRQEDENH
jgi:glycosyltransferase involved in cell wall biosynthesis